jgi:hypothetical protein
MDKTSFAYVAVYAALHTHDIFLQDDFLSPSWVISSDAEKKLPTRFIGLAVC